MAKMDFCALFIDSHGRWYSVPFVIQRECNKFTPPGYLTAFWKDALIYADRYILKKYCENPGIELQLVRLQGSEYILPDQEGGDQK